LKTVLEYFCAVRNCIIKYQAASKSIWIGMTCIISYGFIKRIPSKALFKGGLDAAYDELIIKLPVKYPYNLINYQYVIYSSGKSVAY
jgi:hypothetical protein